MIYKKRYGQPFDTESVVGSFLPMMETIPYLTKEPDGFSYAMEPQDVLYGLGENVRGINKRGWVYTKANAPMTATIPRANPRCTVLIIL